MSEAKKIDQWYFLKSQAFRVHVKVDSETWLMEGFPAEEKEIGDEVLETQLDILRVYDEYGLYTVGVLDYVFGWLEKFVPISWKKKLQDRTPWKHEGKWIKEKK